MQTEGVCTFSPRHTAWHRGGAQPVLAQCGRTYRIKERSTEVSASRGDMPKAREAHRTGELSKSMASRKRVEQFNIC